MFRVNSSVLNTCVGCFRAFKRCYTEIEEEANEVEKEKLLKSEAAVKEEQMKTAPN